MITEQTHHRGLETPACIHVPNVTFGQHQLAAIGAMARKLSASVATWIRVPVLPYAALWEASLNVSLLEGTTSVDRRDEYDRTVSHSADAWLHG